MDALLESNPLEIPNALKHEEMHAQQREAMQRYGIEKAEQAPALDIFAESAEKRVSLGLILRQLIVDKGLTVDASLIRSRVEELCAGYEKSEDMVEMYMSNPQVMQQVEPMVIEQQAVDWIIENGKTTVKKIPFKEFMNPPAS
jgi:trigger factor